MSQLTSYLIKKQTRNDAQAKREAAGITAHLKALPYNHPDRADYERATRPGSGERVATVADLRAYQAKDKGFTSTRKAV
jgi:hypothetical protein